MKPRRVVVMLEIETRMHLTRLRSAGYWEYLMGRDESTARYSEVRQAQANVIRDEKPKGKR